MALNVTIPQQTDFINVRFNPASNTLSLKNTGYASSTLSGLSDVNSIDRANGNILIYDTSVNKYVLQPFNTSLVTDIDGGSF